MGRIANQVRQVLITYTTRRLDACLTLLGLAVLFVMQVGMLVNATNALRIAKSAATLVGLPAIVLPFLLVLHVKAQFAHPRAVLTPNFRVPHLTIPAAILAILLFGFPVLVASWTNCDPLGLSAFACALAVPVIWGLQFYRMVSMLIALIVIISVARSETLLQWWVMPNNDLIVVRLLIVLAGWTAAAAWLWRLSQLGEEMDDYETIPTNSLFKRWHSEDAATRRLVAHQVGRYRLAAAISDWWHTRLRKVKRESFRSQRRLLEFGLSYWPAELSSLLFAGAILAFGIVGGELMSHPMRMMLHAQLGFVLLAVLIAVPWQKFMHHRSPMVGELMFPMTRTQSITTGRAGSMRKAP